MQTFLAILELLLEPYDEILFFTDRVYEKLVSLIVGSYYVTLYQNNVIKSSSQVIAETAKDLGQLNDFQNKVCIDIHIQL